jgi:hypothetical protein
MTNLCKIGDMRISITHQNNPHLLQNIEKYETHEISDFYLRSVFCDTLDESFGEPYKQDSFRKFYRTNHQEIIDVYHQQKVVKAQIVMDEDSTDITIYMIPRYFPNIEDSEYAYLAIFFSEIAMRRGYVLIHSSAVQMHGKAYLFSAPSGGGKTTHVSHYSSFVEDLKIINDDLALVKENLVYGSPFSGQTKSNQNIASPIASIVFLTKGSFNRINKVSEKESLPKLIENLLRPSDASIWDLVLRECEKLIQKVPFYEGIVTKDISSAHAIYDVLVGIREKI